MTDRPDPQREVPEGYELVAVPEEDDWRVEDGSEGCRRATGHNGPPCGRPAVMALRRTSPLGRWGPTVQWWRYCAEHSYGRWVENGQVMHWILREKIGTGGSGDG